MTMRKVDGVSEIRAHRGLWSIYMRERGVLCSDRVRPESITSEVDEGDGQVKRCIISHAPESAVGMKQLPGDTALLRHRFATRRRQSPSGFDIEERKGSKFDREYRFPLFRDMNFFSGVPLCRCDSDRIGLSPEIYIVHIDS
jgi:hypothetical protein